MFNKKIIITILVLILIIGIPIYIYLFTDIGTGKSILSDSDMETLKEELNNKYYNYGSSGEISKLPYEIANEYEIYGIIKNNNAYYIYGYASTQVMVNFKGKAYVSSGKWGNFYAKATIADNNKLLIIDFSNEKDVYYVMPSRCKKKSKVFNKEKFNNKIRNEVSNRLGVPFEKDYELKINGNHYELYYRDKNGNNTLKEEGDL